MKKSSYFRNLVQGFTIIELMITVVVLGVLLSLALPSFQQLMNNNRIVSETNGLVSDLALARSEALKRGGTTLITVCARANDTSCTGTVDWGKGHLVFVESNATGTVGSVDTGETVIRSSAVSEGMTIVAAGFSTAGYVAYNSTGAITSTTPGTITICRSGYAGRIVSVTTTGRVSLANTSTNCP